MDAAAVGLLRAAVHERSEVDQHVIDAISGVRRSGTSWSAIGTFVGTSAEAARQRYADKVADLNRSGRPIAIAPGFF